MICGALFGFTFSTQAQTSVNPVPMHGTQLEISGVQAIAKGKVKDDVQFEQAAQVLFSLDGLTLHIPDHQTTLTFAYETEWRVEPNQVQTIGLVDPTGWQWIATYNHHTGNLQLTDGGKWTYSYHTALSVAQAE